MNSNNIRMDIRNALLDAFGDRKKLEIMLNDQLNQNLNSIVGNGGLEQVVFDLVTQFESKGNLDELVIAAIRQNPGNHQLEGLADRLDEMFSLKDIHSPDNQWNISQQNCSQIFKLIFDNIEFDLFKNTSISVIRQEKQEPNILEKLDRLKNLFNDLSENEKYYKIKEKLNHFLLKKLLFHEYPTLNESLTIIKIVEYLSEENNLEALKQELYNLIRESNNSINIITENQINYDQVDNSYLMIIINQQYDVNGYIIYENRDSKNFNKIVPLDIDPEELENNGSSGFSSKKLKKAADLFVNQGLEQLQKDDVIPSSLKIQFFLPYENLSEEVDRYEFSHQVSSRKLTIGYEYQVVVRSYDRIIDAHWNGKLENGMKRLEDFVTDNEECQEAFEFLDELDDKKMQNLTYKLENKIGLKLNCSLPKYKKQRKKFFEIILDSGIPIALWKNDSKTYNQEDYNIDRVLDNVSLSNLSTFSQNALQERKRLQNHLALLCEEPRLDKEFRDAINPAKNYLGLE